MESSIAFYFNITITSKYFSNHLIFASGKKQIKKVYPKGYH